MELATTHNFDDRVLVVIEKKVMGVGVVVLVMVLSATVAAAQVPAIFSFGDSLIDAGNNNFLSSIAKSNYYPYGIDFRGGATGRFSNGRTFVDLLGNMLGLPYAPAFADPNEKGNRMLRGVNYASAAGGILDETGQHYGDRFTLNRQVLNFESDLNQLRTMMGANLTQFLAKSIAVLVFGSNDYINNYLMDLPLYNASIIYTPLAFANLLLNRYTAQILALRSLGLRKFVLVGIGPLGCIPNQRATGQGQRERCVDRVNQVLGPFNQGLRSLVAQLNSNHPDSIFVYGNAYGAFGDILNNPAPYGFTVIDRGCCSGYIGRNQGQITCLPFAVPCPNRNQYMFWDAFHPTEAATAVLAWRAFNGPPSDAYPINVQQLAQI